MKTPANYTGKTPWDDLTDTRRFWWLTNDAGPDGFHSHDARARGVSGNPSQRSKDCVSKGQPMCTAREPRGGRPGSRYWLAKFAPDFAVPVAPNGAERGGDAIASSVGGAPACHSSAPLSLVRTPSGGDSIGRSLEDAVLEASAGRSEISLEDFEQTTLVEAA